MLSGQQSDMGSDDPPPGSQSAFRSTISLHPPNTPSEAGLLQETKRKSGQVSKFPEATECQSLNISLETLRTATRVWDFVSEGVRGPIALQIPAALLPLSVTAV